MVEEKKVEKKWKCKKMKKWCVFFDLERVVVRAQNMIRSQHASTDNHDSNLVVSLRSHSDCLSQQLFSARR